jgi:hypothetical protein
MNKIEFFSSVEGVLDTFPILAAKDCLPKWINKARADYLQDKQSASIFRCPGIVDIMTTGYIVTSWHDINIESTDAGVEAWSGSTVLEELLDKPTMQIQQGDSIAKYLPKRPWSNKDIIKINTPWHVKSKYKLLMIPIPYNDEFILESSVGILDPSISSEINIQSYVNCTGVVTIPAGTPLCQLIPITDDKVELLVREMNRSDKRWLQISKYINHMSTVLNRKQIKKAYNKYIKGS